MEEEIVYGDDDYDDYVYEEDGGGAGDSASGAPPLTRRFLDGSEADLALWAQGNLCRLSVAAAIRQIVHHPSNKMSVFFTREDLLKNDPLKDFTVLVSVENVLTVSYSLKFDSSKEIAYSPPVLTCMSYCGRATYLFPNLMLPDIFGAFLDFGKVFFRLSQELELYYGSLPEVDLKVQRFTAQFIEAHSMPSLIMKLAYLTQYRTSAVIDVSVDDNGIATGKFRDATLSSADSGVGYASSNLHVTKHTMDDTRKKQLTELFNGIRQTIDENVFESPLLEIISGCLNEFSVEEVVHSPVYSTALFHLIAAVQTVLRECTAEAASIELRGDAGRKRKHEAYDLDYIYNYFEKYVLNPLIEYKSVLGGDFGLDIIDLPVVSGAPTATCTAETVPQGKSVIAAVASEEELKGSVVVVESFGTFHFSSSVSSVSPSFMRRIRVELNTLKNNRHPNIHVLCNNQDMSKWKFLIIGPVDTPYDGGFFIFDMKLPGDYPNSHPQVILKTTGQGTVRFNPNLYACGKVCLSLLGTWAGEPWNPELSNINQILMSICFMIFVEEPYYNEPGFNRPGPGVVDTHSIQYNMEVRRNTVSRAVLDHLQFPDPDFGELIYRLIRSRWPSARSVYQRWTEDANCGPDNKFAILNSISVIERLLN